MGFTPAQVDAMSAWQFMACCGGINESNGGNPPPGEISDDRLRAMGVEGF